MIESLRFGETQSAKEALAGVTEGASRDIAFHRMAAAVAMALRQTGALVGHLQRILQLDPSNAEARFNLAALRVWGDAAELVELAIAELRALTAPGNPMRVRAALELLKLSARTLDKGSIDGLIGCDRQSAIFQVALSDKDDDVGIVQNGPAAPPPPKGAGPGPTTPTDPRPPGQFKLYGIVVSRD